MIELHNGDCLTVMKTIADKSVDLILCDPPYGTTQIAWDSIIPLDLMWGEYKRILKDDGCVILFGSQPFSSVLVTSNIDWFKYELIWDKNKCGSPGLAKYRPMKTHENILIFAKGKTKYFPIMEEGEPYVRKAKDPGGYKSRCNNHKYGFKNAGRGIPNLGTRYPKSIRRVSRDFSAQQQVHPTQKPVPLLEWLVKTYSKEGDVVLDNCMGSGSTGVAAVMNDRSFIGIEKEPEYFQIARDRVNAGASKLKDFLS